MKLRNISSALALSGLLLALPGCKGFFDVNVDPLRPTQADVSQLMPVSQTAMATYLGFSIQGLGQPTSALMQQLSNGRGIGTYNQNGDSFSNPWNGLYSAMLANNELVITQGTASSRWNYVGVAQIQKAYVFSQMVDMFGDIPYSEALKGVANTAPRFDEDQDIYLGNPALGIQSLFALIDEGMANLDKPSSGAGVVDLYYGGDLAKWRRFANTLKLKLYTQIRKTRADGYRAEIQALLAPATPSTPTMPGYAGLLQTGDDLEFKYGSSASPENRNIGYLQDYVNVGRENNIGRFLYLLMQYRDGTRPDPTAAMGANPDPRIPYYFFNQLTSGSVDPAAFDYQDPNNFRFATSRAGSTGSANASTLSASTRTLPGLYPVGGRFDDGRGGNANSSFARGQVAQRLLPYFSRKYLEAEVQLVVLNNRMAAREALREAIEASFAKVNAIVAAEVAAGGLTQPNIVGYSDLTVTRPFAPIAPAAITSYVTAALARFDANTSARPSLAVIMEEKYVASFGMGPDIYTDWRRTGYPLITVPDVQNIGDQVGLTEDSDASTSGAGLFPRRLFYSQRDLTSNINPTAPKVQVDPLDPNYRIFWDVR